MSSAPSSELSPNITTSVLETRERWWTSSILWISSTYSEFCRLVTSFSTGVCSLTVYTDRRAPGIISTALHKQLYCYKMALGLHSMYVLVTCTTVLDLPWLGPVDWRQWLPPGTLDWLRQSVQHTVTGSIKELYIQVILQPNITKPVLHTYPDCYVHWGHRWVLSTIIESHGCKDRRYSTLEFTQVLSEVEYSSLLLQGDQWSRRVSESIPHYSKISVILVHGLHGMDTVTLEISLHYILSHLYHPNGIIWESCFIYT